MADLELFEGAVVRTPNFKHYADDGKQWIQWKAPKGKVFVMMILGLESKIIKGENDCLDSLETIQQLAKSFKKGETKSDSIEAEISSVGRYASI